jgi:hypothetical protein
MIRFEKFFKWLITLFTCSLVSAGNLVLPDYLAKADVVVRCVRIDNNGQWKAQILKKSVTLSDKQLEEYRKGALGFSKYKRQDVSTYYYLGRGLDMTSETRFLDVVNGVVKIDFQGQEKIVREVDLLAHLK